ncbi:hypothetical protein H0H92_012158 [Tricholoma furcatifolium]|nr:hypothetical protein H0H92_012158 [Tricholoma furcatifolium]
MSDMGSDGTSSLQSDTGNQRSMKNALVNQDKVQFSFDDVGNQQQKTNDVEFKVDSDELVKKIERESLLHQIDEQKIQIKALREELALRKDKARSRSEPWSPSAQLRHTVSELFVENLDRFERGPEGLDNTAPPKAVDATGVEKIHQ